MSGGAPIAHGGPQRLPARAAPSLVRALRDARGSPPWAPGTILWRLDRPRHSYTTCIHVGGVDRRPSRLGHFGQPLSVITSRQAIAIVSRTPARTDLRCCNTG